MIKRYGQEEIDKLSQILKNDGVISVPTDTVYGICGSINSQIAYNKLVKIKNRPKEKSFPIMCASEEQIKNIAIVDKRAEQLIRAFMPGPITLVLKSKCQLPKYVTNGKDTIAVRMATSESLKNLITKVGCPIFMTSANRSGEPECKNLDEIEKNCPLLEGMMEGEVHYSKGSTIVDCTLQNLQILRAGPITLDHINSLENMN